MIGCRSSHGVYYCSIVNQLFLDRRAILVSVTPGLRETVFFLVAVVGLARYLHKTPMFSSAQPGHNYLLLPLLMRKKEKTSKAYFDRLILGVIF